MALDSFLFTHSPYLLARVPLASFVPYRTQPDQDTQTPYEVTQADYDAQLDEDFEGLVSTNSRSSFSAVLSRVFSLSLLSEQETKFRLKDGVKGYVYSLKQPENLFEKLVFSSHPAGEAIRHRFESWSQRKINPYFVVGLRTFVDATIERAEHQHTNMSGRAGIPTSAAQGDPTGTLDVNLGGQYQTSHDESHSMKATGERVYAICYRKVNISTKPGRPHTLQPKNMWRSFATRGDEEIPDCYQAELEVEGDLQGLDGFQRQQLQIDGKAVLIYGTPIDESG